MALYRSPTAIAGIREACVAAATVLQRMVEATEIGITTFDLDQIARKAFLELGARSACYNYNPGSGVNPFPAHTCISVNEEVVHGIGSMKRKLAAGDIVSLDVVCEYRGYIGDNATTVVLPGASAAAIRLVDVTREALDRAIRAAVSGNRVGDISHAVESFVRKAGFGIVRDFVGHGVGESMHEAPQIPNFGRPRSGPRLSPGMTLAIEPMITERSHKVRMLDDGWTAVTADGKLAAHFEHTVLITEGSPEILTISKK